MIGDKSILAIIPARGNSKRLPKKNLLPLKNKPLIQWSIEAGICSKYIDKIIVSSDNDEIIKKSKEAGADIIKRPDILAIDNASSFSVIEHVIDNIDELFDFTILLQPTSPLRTYKHIDESLELLISKNADAIISVCETEHSPLWSNTLPDDGNMQNFMRNEILHMKSQNMPKYYRLNGAIYICKTEKLINNKTLFIPDNIFSYIMDRKDSIDIDYEIDLQYAEFIFNHN